MSLSISGRSKFLHVSLARTRASKPTQLTSSFRHESRCLTVEYAAKCSRLQNQEEVQLKRLFCRSPPKKRLEPRAPPSSLAVRDSRFHGCREHFFGRQPLTTTLNASRPIHKTNMLDCPDQQLGGHGRFFNFGVMISPMVVGTLFPRLTTVTSRLSGYLCDPALE